MTSNKTSLSVLISVYKNCVPEYLSKALYSIYDGQIIKPDQIVLVIDGEIKLETLTCILEFKKRCPYLEIVELEKSAGFALR